ncbi:MAG: hypothetical protein K0M70_06020 [Arenimonas sp.]|uniref:hypothetical protein n=1 Tax=Arenimonas sp. TaxID=1872635 RepID=UPI0025C43848|nr:hypothetical protein [Arenimonas sp.]MBW8367397.1 hypothetical protein [Arenimonas sp.]
MRRTTVFLLALSAGTFAGCALEHPATGIGKRVTVETLEAGEFAGRFKASTVSQGEATVLDYAAALLQASGQRCNDSYSVQDQSPRLLNMQEMESIVPAGEELSMTVACAYDRLPGHRIVNKGETGEFYGAAPQGVSQKMGYGTVRKDQNRRVVAESLAGNFLREVYTEDCAGKAVLVEKIVMLSEPIEPTALLPNVENIHVAMHYRCVDSSTVAAPLAAAAAS